MAEIKIRIQADGIRGRGGGGIFRTRPSGGGGGRDKKEIGFNKTECSGGDFIYLEKRYILPYSTFNSIEMRTNSISISPPPSNFKVWTMRSAIYTHVGKNTSGFVDLISFILW